MNNIPRRARLILGGFIVLFIAGCSNLPGPISNTGNTAGTGPHIIQGGLPDNLDTNLTKISEQGYFEVSILSHLDPISINEIHSWTVTVLSSTGVRIENAAISIDHLMPQHGHGMPTAPEMSQNLGNGEYLIEGIKFNMSGWWVVDLIIETPNERDQVSFNFILR